jgi:hypothetical protein
MCTTRDQSVQQQVRNNLSCQNSTQLGAAVAATAAISSLSTITMQQPAVNVYAQQNKGTLVPGQTISVNKYTVQVERYLSQGVLHPVYSLVRR